MRVAVCGEGAEILVGVAQQDLHARLPEVGVVAVCGAAVAWLVSLGA